MLHALTFLKDLRKKRNLIFEKIPKRWNIYDRIEKIFGNNVIKKMICEYNNSLSSSSLMKRYTVLEDLMHILML